MVKQLIRQSLSEMGRASSSILNDICKLLIYIWPMKLLKCLHIVALVYTGLCYSKWMVSLLQIVSFIESLF